MLRTTFILRNVLMLVGPHLKYINFTRTCTIAKPGTIPVSSISCATSSLILSRIFLRGYSKYNQKSWYFSFSNTARNYSRGSRLNWILNWVVKRETSKEIKTCHLNSLSMDFFYNFLFIMFENFEYNLPLCAFTYLLKKLLASLNLNLLSNIFMTMNYTKWEDKHPI